MAIPELPSVGFYGRLTNAMQAWERRYGRVGQRGSQALIVAKMQEIFGANAPAPAALSQWLRRETAPGPDGAFMLAHALEVRPEWLTLGLGQMVAKDDEDHQGAHLNHTPGPRIGPTVHTTPVVQSSRLDDPPAPQGKPVRRPRGRSAVA
jgi:hypothetical protein